jgi:NhaP-type Na+/H+ or K+/H+ antiporter
MDTVIYTVVALFGFALVSRRLSTTPITGPIIFVALGLLASSGGLDIFDSESTDVGAVVDIVFQGTLVLVLFTDASALNLGQWRQDAALPGRLLGIGLPLTIGLGGAAAALLFTDLDIWEAMIIGAIIAPTDAALGQAVISNPRVPERIRQALDVESGLNDGVSLPFVLIFIGLAGRESDTGVGETFVNEIGIAVAVGIAVGLVGGWLLVRASKVGWVDSVWSSLAVISLALTAFVVADEAGGSGFIAAFVAGMSYGQYTRGRIAANEILAGDLGTGLVQVSFLLFGALVLEPALGNVTWQVLVMALVALTITRIGPVALSMIGAGLSGPTLLYLGWFGPRGLATIVFAVLVVEESDLPGVETITTVAAITVGVSVLLHGLSAYPGSQRYADWVAAKKGELPEKDKVHHHRLRPRLRRTSANQTPARGTGTPPPATEG